MGRWLRTTLVLASLTAAAVLMPGAGRAFGQISYRGAGYFGGGMYWGGGYSFERFRVFTWRDPFIPSPYGFGLGGPALGLGSYYGLGGAGYYGLGFGGYGMGWPYGFNSNVESPPLMSYAQYPIFTYVASSQNAPRPKVLNLNPPSDSQSANEGGDRSTHAAQGAKPAEEGHRPVIYRASVPGSDRSSGQPAPRAASLIVHRATAG